jgi:hypothetical protein
LEGGATNQKPGIFQKKKWVANSDHEMDCKGKMIGDIEKVQIGSFYKVQLKVTTKFISGC